MSQNQTVNEYQFKIASRILERLREAIKPDYLGLVSTDGHSITALSTPGFTDTDAVASLAASSYAATRQLARLVSDSDLTMMFNEGDELNVHIAQVTDKMLLVVCFQHLADMGRVRLLTNRALGALVDAMSRYEVSSGNRSNGAFAESADEAVEMLIAEDEEVSDGPD